GCAATGRLLASYRLSRWWGLAFAGIPGAVVGVMFGTAEPLALGLSALGLSLATGRRPLAAGLAFAAAGLAKGAYLGFSLAAAGYLLVAGADPLRDRAGRAAAVLLPGVAVLAGWWTYAGRMVPPNVTDSVGIRSFTLPFAGWTALFRAIAGGRYVP